MQDEKSVFVKEFTDILSIHSSCIASSTQMRKLEAKMSKELDELNYNFGIVKRKKRLENKTNIVICISIRGDITQRVYAIWESQLPKTLSKHHVQISNTLLSNADIIVVPPNISSTTFASWKGDGLLSADAFIVNSDWAVNAIKTNSFAPLTPHIVTSLTPITLHIDHATETTKHPRLSADVAGTLTDPQAEINKLRQTTGQYYHAGYACIKTGEIKSVNANKYITDILENLQGIYDLCGDEWRSQGYKKAVAALKQFSRVTNIDQLNGIKGIGSSIREKIQEILTTGGLKKLHYFQDDPKIKAMMELSKIWGVGPKKAGNFIKQGINSVYDLRQRGMHLLTKQQLIGLKHYEELLVKIPRAEMDQLHEFVKSCCVDIVPNYQSVVCGSYRRGKPQSGDIDVLIAPASKEMQIETHDILAQLIEVLTVKGLLTDHLTLPHHTSAAYLKHLPVAPQQGQVKPAEMSTLIPSTMAAKGKTGKKEIDYDDSQEYNLEDVTRASYMGVCKLPNQPKAIHRRIDIKIYPHELLPFAMLYFTGSDHFNRSMRLYAKKRGFSLSDKGLTYQEKVRYFPNFPYKIGEMIPCQSEEEIFQVLGLPFKAPHERNVFDIDHQFTDQMQEDDYADDQKMPFQLNEDSDDD